MLRYKFRSFLNTKEFTLIELIIVIAFFSFISVILMSSLLAVYHFKEVAHDKKELNAEASSILNNGLPGLIRSGFAINYDLTRADVRQEFKEGMQDEVDHVSIFTNRAETEYFTIYRKPHLTEGDQSDTAPLYIKLSNGEEFPLHSSEVVVEDFDVHLPTDPRISGELNLAPYVSLYFRFRHRYPFGEIPEESQFKIEKPIRASYSTTIGLRNAGTGANKFPRPIPNLSAVAED